MKLPNHGNMASDHARQRLPAKVLTLSLTLATIGMLMAMPAQAQQPSLSALSCDDGIAKALSGLEDTKVLLVHHFGQGEQLVLSSSTVAATSVEGTGSANAPFRGTHSMVPSLANLATDNVP